MWIFIGGVYCNINNVNRIKIEDLTVTFYYNNDSPITFYNVTKKEIGLLMKKINNEN